MGFRYAIISGFLGQLKDRFKFYHEARNLKDKFALARTIEGVDGLELVYPYDFQDLSMTKELLEHYRLLPAAVNVDIKGEAHWNRRSLSAESRDTRKKAVEYISRGMELARELGANLVTVCPLQDGYDYHFEMDYSRAWRYFVEGVREAATAFPDIRLSLEYKGAEPLAQYLLSNVHSALFTCCKTGLTNVGVTLDTGHALFAKENPAESLALLQGEGRLFHVHINDNDGNWDWDLISGGRNLLGYLEFIYYLVRSAYQGWIALDVTPKNRDTAEVLATSIHLSRVLEKKAAEIDHVLIERNILDDTPHKTLRYLYDEVL
ncbi:MAG TPA: TIM barrel protein [Atribacteraceae bacterium]|nr:TIM barrel protein [Atribacteraceae bacterium]